MASGTFVYKFDFSGSAPTDVSNNLPIINTSGSFTTLTPSYSVSGNTMTVNIAYVFVDNGTTNNGLSFNNLSTYYNNFTALTVTAFGSIPLARGGSQFRLLSRLIFTASDAPTILPNTSLSNCFRDCATFNSPVNNWNTTNVTNFAGIFRNATAFNQPLSNWNISNSTNVNLMFANSAFNQDLSAWGSNLPTNLNSIFSNIISTSNLNIGGWNTSLVTNMSYMFYNSPFNSSINSWNVSAVTTMEGMFENATAFNQPLNSWNISNVTNMTNMFTGATSFSPNGSNTYLDQMLNSWALLPVHTGVTLDAPLAYYSASGVASYNTLVNTKSWTIHANGPAPPPPPVICFKEGTKLLCLINSKETYVPIEDIRKGVLVKTSLNGYKKVEMIGHSKIYNPSNSLHSKNRLYKLSAKN